MNKTVLKNYAVWARNTLIEAVIQRAYEYDVTNGGVNDPNQISMGDEPMTDVELSQRRQLIAKIREQGFENTMEEAAYTWFNRFTALRYIEANGYLPSKVRVFTDESGDFKPDVLREALTVEIKGLDREKVISMVENQQNDALFKYLIITQCNELNESLPAIFEEIGGWTELLFPSNLLRESSVLHRMVTDIPEEDWLDQVQIIGWLYQYYNSEPKNKVFADMKKNIKISKENIPAATQLFTPDWIVRYMVENSLGRLWYEGHTDFDKSEWKYYLDEAEQEEAVQAELDRLRADAKHISPEEITFLDPCMGSGHILVYAFDVLMQIYNFAGYSERDAAQLIISKNLWGLDLDKRAYQLAYFAVMMKARQYDRRFLTRGIQPNLSYLQDIPRDISLLNGPVAELAEQFRNADVYGSLISVHEVEGLDAAIDEFTGLIGFGSDVLEHFMQLYKIIGQKYDVVCTNPPYMGGSGMNATLSDFVKKYFPDSKSDLFACFMERGLQFVKHNGFNCMVTMQSWMFLSSFEKMRIRLMNDNTITNLMHMENMVMGIAFGTAVTSFRKGYIKGYKGTYNHIKLENIENGMPKEFPIMENRFAQVSSENFSKIPGAPVAYWVSENFVNAFLNKKLGDYGKTCQGLATGDNERFLRLWFECDFNEIFWNCFSHEASRLSNCKWYPCTKGGSFRRWYGNLEYVVDWYQDGYDIRNFKDKNGKLRSRPQNMDLYFKIAYTWSTISSGKFSMRYAPVGSIFETKGSKCFVDDKNFNYLLGLLNTCVVQEMLTFLAPTLDYHEGPVSRIPIKFPLSYSLMETIEKLVEENINISKTDWDSFETSWDFKRHPLIRLISYRDSTDCKCVYLSDCFDNWIEETTVRFDYLKANEEELNRIFIEIYGLQDELTPEVEDKDVTVRKADLQREIKSLLSYAVGCMFGRYSVDCEGLCYAGGEWDDSKYKTIIPDKDNIIPICDDDYFHDDITTLFVDFIRKVYGEDTLEENLKFIADALGVKGATPREVIRNYFLTGFYADHCKIYQKRPIYWLFSSGKKHGFKCLIYIHRYRQETVAQVRTDYVHEIQERYRTQLKMLVDEMEKASPAERTKLKKRFDKLTAQLEEVTAYEEKVHHFADSMIPLDLDDGVKVNYAKLQDILEKIK